MDMNEPTAAEMRKRAGRARSIKISDKKIKESLEFLQSHNRGLNALADFKRLAKGEARGLDIVGMQCLVTLLIEFSKGRREFLEQIKDVVLPPGRILSAEENAAL